MKMARENTNFKGLLEAAIAIAQERQQLLQSLRLALETPDNPEILKIAKKLCGLKQ
jgi:uncharacterized protein YpiB (UPF0302 family)